MGHLIQYGLLRVIVGLLQTMPLRAVRTLARRMAWLLFNGLGVRKAVVLEQLSTAFPEKDPTEIGRFARQAYLNICTTFLELFWSGKLDFDLLRREFRLVNVDSLVRAHARGRGVILLSGHYGNWEWIPHALQAHTGLTGAAIARPMQNPHVDRLVNAYRCQFGGAIIPMQKAVREGLRLLKNGGILMILSDQSAPREAVFVRFLGRYASVFRGPGAFAWKTGAPFIIVNSLRREDGGYDLLFEEIPTDNLPAGQDEAIDELTRRHVLALERTIRERPGDWFWHHRRWKHTPDADSRIIEDRKA